MSKRKPFMRDTTTCWWTKNGYYLFYMFREGTAVFAIWFSLELIAFVFSIVLGGDAFLCMLNFLRNPLVLFLNFVTLLGTLFHSLTWFQLTPKATQVVFQGKKLPEMVPVASFWGMTVLVTAVVLWLALK